MPTTHLHFCRERGWLLDLLSRTASDYARLADELAIETRAISTVGYLCKGSQL